LRAVRASTGRFSLEVSEKDASNILYAALKAVIQQRGGQIVLDTDTRDHIAATARWLIDPVGSRGLLLCGTPGNGKTVMAMAISWLIEYLTEKELGSAYREVVKFYTAKGICRLCAAAEKFKEQYDAYEHIFTHSMILIDDLGAEPTEITVYGQTQTPIIDIISERYRTQRLTIITSNLDVDDIRAKYGERIYDRLREMLTPITYLNPSYRGVTT
jgi:DNA replication protein DnaC